MGTLLERWVSMMCFRCAPKKGPDLGVWVVFGGDTEG